MDRSATYRCPGPAKAGPLSAARLWRGGLLSLALAMAVTFSGGCSDSKKPEAQKFAPPPRYPTLPPKENVPAFMKGTLFELVDAENTEPFLISGYGLVVGLSGTGNNNGTPLSVRNYMTNEMVRRGFGAQDSAYQNLKPDLVLRDSRTAIAEVYAYVPPGARAGQRMDVFVQAAAGSETTSLSRGKLYLTDLGGNGVDPFRPGGSINIFGRAQGPIFVNPTYAVSNPGTRPASQGSLRAGLILNGGMITADRHIRLRTRTPQLRVALAVERRIDQRFVETPDSEVAKTVDEGVVQAFVPRSMNGDWEHFLGVATHLYLNGSPEFGAVKARELANEAVQPDALLQDISYCWEGIGEPALPFIRPLYGHTSPDVAFAAARAGAHLSDAAAEQALLEMAHADDHPFQLNAVKTLAALPESPRIARMLTELLATRNALVRVEAYRILAQQRAPVISSRPVRDLFIIDRVQCDGPPLVYATRSGVPRIAIFGRNLSLRLPIMFTAMNSGFTISTAPDGRSIAVFDRTGVPGVAGTQARMRPDLFEVLWRLAGGANDGFSFGYSDLVGILKLLSDGQHIPAAFVLQDIPALEDEIESAPPIVEPADVRQADNSVPPTEIPNYSRAIRSGNEK